MMGMPALINTSLIRRADSTDGARIIGMTPTLTMRSRLEFIPQFSRTCRYVSWQRELLHQTRTEGGGVPGAYLYLFMSQVRRWSEGADSTRYMFSLNLNLPWPDDLGVLVPA